MLGGLAGAKDDLGEAAPNLTMMVDAGKTKVLEGQMPKLFNSVVNTDLFVFDLL